MKYAYLFIAFLLCGCYAADKPKEKLIRVTGEGKLRVKPDLVILTINISFTKPAMADAVKLTQSTVDSVINILSSFGTNDDIKTSSISANKEYNYNGRNPVFTGYSAQQSIDFVLNDINQFTKLTGKLLETRINSIGEIQFGHSKADSLFREADLLAYDDAFKSAKKLCDRADVKLGDIVFLSNTELSGDDSPESYSAGQGINTFSKAYGGRGFKIAPEVLEFRRNIISAYLIVE